MDALQTDLKVQEKAARDANARALMHLNQVSTICPRKVDVREGRVESGIHQLDE
jgi:hypothetical protein